MRTGAGEWVVEGAALTWLASSGFAVAHGPQIAVGQPGAERSDPTYRDVVLEWRLREALVRLNPDLPQEALDDAFRKIVRAEGASLIERNRAVHRMLVDGVTVEFRRADGLIKGEQARPRVISVQDPACYPAPNWFSQCYADPSNHCWAVDTMTSTPQFLE
jgi:type I restriction enzyme R subunit